MRNLTQFLHLIWSQIVPKGAAVIDATCGAGHDTLALAQMALTSKGGSLLGIDIQKEAIEKTALNLKMNLAPNVLDKIELLQADHGDIETLCPHLGQVDFVAYNLGYFPGGDKSRTTLAESTVKSLKAAFNRLKDGGYICVTCYIGHPEGPGELKAVDAWIGSLNPADGSVYHIELPKDLAPKARLIQKGKSRTYKMK